MDLESARQICRELSESAVVVDIGGGAAPFPRADYVLDSLPFEKRSALGTLGIDIQPRYSKSTWVTLDLCRRDKWPFPDKFFDYATCSHLLEDIRDPIWVCQELCRVAKAGYIEVPSRVVEQSLGVEHPLYAGYYHHRWLITPVDKGLEFRQKPHSLHSCNDAIVARIGIRREINPEHAAVAFRWTVGFDFKEILEFDESRLIAELCDYARQARSLPKLTIPSTRPVMGKLKRAMFFQRLRMGWR